MNFERSLQFLFIIVENLPISRFCHNLWFMDSEDGFPHFSSSSHLPYSSHIFQNSSQLEESLQLHGNNVQPCDFHPVARYSCPKLPLLTAIRKIYPYASQHVLLRWSCTSSITGFSLSPFTCQSGYSTVTALFTTAPFWLIGGSHLT